MKSCGSWVLRHVTCSFSLPFPNIANAAKRRQWYSEYKAIEIESSELDKEIVRKVVRNLKPGRSLRSMGGVNEDQMSFFR